MKDAIPRYPFRIAGDLSSKFLVIAISFSAEADSVAALLNRSQSKPVLAIDFSEKQRRRIRIEFFMLK